MNLQEVLSKINDCELKHDYDLTSFTTMRLASRGDLIEVNTVEALQKVLPLLNTVGRSYLVVGWGANQILPPVCKDVIIHLNLAFDSSYLDTQKDEYVLPASLGINHLTAHAVKFGLKGWEVFTGIPASLGGAIYMNAGTNLGEIGNLVTHVELVTPNGILREEKINAQSFSYRKNYFVNPGEVIVGARLVHKGLDQEISLIIRTIWNTERKLNRSQLKIVDAFLRIHLKICRPED